MKVEETILRSILNEALSDGNNRPKAFENRFKTTMYNMYDITPGEAIAILNGTISTEIMPKETMYKTLKVLYDINKSLNDGFDIKKLEADRYFTEREIENFSQKVNRKKEDKDIIIENWIRVAEDQYVTVLTIGDIVDLINRNKIRYNPETQRNLVIKETQNGVEKHIKLFPKALEEIEESMINNNYISNAITFNINPDKFEPPKINKGKLIISKDSIIDCIDGFHRLKVANIVKIKIPDWNKNFIINIMVFDKNKAIRYILQEDKKNHLSNEQVMESDHNDAANFILNKLIESNNFYHRSYITDKKVVLNVLINSIFKPKRLISVESRSEAVRLFTLIEKNINNFIEVNDFYKKEFTKTEWFIYLYVLKYCLDNNMNFIDIINKIPVNSLLEDINFSSKPISKHFNLMSEVVNNV
jgi:hypothetical protein